MTTSVNATATQLKPLGDRLVVQPTPREEMEARKVEVTRV